MESSDLEIPFLRAVFPDGIQESLAEVFRSGYVGSGELVSSFERALEAYLGAPAALATSSCTAALTLTYVDVGIAAGSFVLSTPMSCAATNIPLLQLGARIEWLDVDPFSGNVTAESVAEGLQRCEAAKAVVIMDWGGVPCDYPAIASECRRRETPLILDAAQSFGSSYLNSLSPTDADYVCHSFGPTKLFSSVEGGAILAKSDAKIERMRTLRWYGIHREARDSLRFWECEVEELGYRFVSNNVSAAIGLRMLTQIDERLRHHRELAAAYDEMLTGIPGLRIGVRPPGSKPNFWLYTILVEERERLMSKLHSRGVHAATPHKRNDYLLAAWNNAPPLGKLVGLDQFSEQYLCLPIGSWMRLVDIEKVCQFIKDGW
jgi:dTDP-4-amino-4,6-dideoxygalactose transaminase